MGNGEESMEQFNILVCDDDTDIVSAIEIYLKIEGYRVFKAYDGMQALDVVEQNPIHLVLMDVMMPLLDGIHAMVKIRDKRNIPILILSAKSEDTDKILGLNMGADDYITKPFNPLELIARVKSSLRRYAQLGSLEKKTGVYTSGGLCLDDENKSVTVDNESVSLTPIEYNILLLLIKNKGRVFSSEQIFNLVWNEPHCSDNIVAVHIRHLREKIEINPKEPRYIKVVWGLGYKVERIDQ